MKMTPEREPVDLPAVIDRAQKAWKEIEQSNLGDRMKRALRRIACGQGVRESAELEGYGSHQDLHRYAKRFGLIDVRTSAIVNTHRNVAKLAGEEMERRLIEAPDEINTPALAVIGGISTDKVLNYEKIQTDDGSSYLSALEKMAERFADGGTTLEQLSVMAPAFAVARLGLPNSVLMDELRRLSPPPKFVPSPSMPSRPVR